MLFIDNIFDTNKRIFMKHLSHHFSKILCSLLLGALAGCASTPVHAMSTGEEMQTALCPSCQQVRLVTVPTPKGPRESTRGRFYVYSQDEDMGTYGAKYFDPLTQVPCCTKKITSQDSPPDSFARQEEFAQHVFAYGDDILDAHDKLVALQTSAYATNVPPALLRKDQLETLYIGQHGRDFFVQLAEDAKPTWMNLKALGGVNVVTNDLQALCHASGDPIAPNLQHLSIHQKSGAPWAAFPPLKALFPTLQRFTLYGRAGVASVGSDAFEGHEALEYIQVPMPLDGIAEVAGMPNLERAEWELKRSLTPEAAQALSKEATTQEQPTDTAAKAPKNHIAYPKLADQVISVDNVPALHVINVRPDLFVMQEWKRTGEWAAYTNIWQDYVAGQRTFPGITVECVNEAGGFYRVKKAPDADIFPHCAIIWGQGIVTFEEGARFISEQQKKADEAFYEG